MFATNLGKIVQGVVMEHIGFEEAFVEGDTSAIANSTNRTEGLPCEGCKNVNVEEGKGGTNQVKQNVFCRFPRFSLDDSKTKIPNPKLQSVKLFQKNFTGSQDEGDAFPFDGLYGRRFSG